MKAYLCAEVHEMCFFCIFLLFFRFQSFISWFIRRGTIWLKSIMTTRRYLTDDEVLKYSKWEKEEKEEKEEEKEKNRIGSMFVDTWIFTIMREIQRASTWIIRLVYVIWKREGKEKWWIREHKIQTRKNKKEKPVLKAIFRFIYYFVLTHPITFPIRYGLERTKIHFK